MKYIAPLLLSVASITASASTIVATDTYSWHGDTITQGEYTAYAVSPDKIVSTYSPEPGYYMGIDRVWERRNDISNYPRLVTDNLLHTATYNMGLDEMVNAVEPDTTLRTGKEWAGVWTRDVSYSILLSMAYLQPLASEISLMKKVDSKGRIIQDTGSGGAWPVSTDRQIWTVAAFEVYKVTGDRRWLEYIYPVAKRSLETDAEAFYGTASGLVKGETSFVDWRGQSHPLWMQNADIYNTETLSTSVVHARAWDALRQMAEILGHKDAAKIAATHASNIAQAINATLWLPDKGYYAMYRYGRDNFIVNPRAELLGESLSIMWDIADADRARTITESVPVTPFGPGIFYPQIADMPPYHNNSLWPWVAAWWAMANAKAGNEEGTMLAIGSIIRPAALFCTNKENFVLDNGDIATWLNSSNMLWCLSGNIALTHKILFGIDYRVDGLAFHPFVPRALSGKRSLEGFVYRDATLDINISGHGNAIKSFRINGREAEPFLPAKKARGHITIDIEMADNAIAPLPVNLQPNACAPLTPQTWMEGNTLRWDPIDYISNFIDIAEWIVLRDGKEVARTRANRYDASTPGEYQVVAVSTKGHESFASQPRSNRPTTHVAVPQMMLTKGSQALSIPVVVPTTGRYFVHFDYANGNGPVNTENKCGIRTLLVDGTRAGIVVLPQRGTGNWDEVGTSNSLPVDLSAGEHILTLVFTPDNENMNIDVNSARIDGVTLTLDTKQ